jgi:hypothetical protein
MDRLPSSTPQLCPANHTREHWRFSPGSRVRCELRELSDGPALVAAGMAT